MRQAYGSGLKLIVNGRVVYLPYRLCADCGDMLRSRNAERCHRCANRARHPEIEPLRCIACGGTRTAGSRSGLCWSCWTESRKGTAGHAVGDDLARCRYSRYQAGRRPGAGPVGVLVSDRDEAQGDGVLMAWQSAAEAFDDGDMPPVRTRARTHVQPLETPSVSQQSPEPITGRSVDIVGVRKRNRDVPVGSPSKPSVPDQLYASELCRIRSVIGYRDQIIAILMDRIEGYENGEIVLCVAGGCNNRLGYRLLEGFSTCSPECSGALRAETNALPKAVVGWRFYNRGRGR